MLFDDGLRVGLVMSRHVSQPARSSDEIEDLVASNRISYKDDLKVCPRSDSLFGKRVSEGTSLHKAHHPHPPYRNLNPLQPPRSNGVNPTILGHRGHSHSSSITSSKYLTN